MRFAHRRVVPFGVGAALAVLGACAGDSGAGTGLTPTELTLRLTPKIDSLAVGDVRQLAAHFTNTTGVPQRVNIAWTSLDRAVAKVSANGSVIGVSAGLVKIVASMGNVADTAVLVIRARQQLVVKPNAVLTSVGEAVKFSAAARSGTSPAGSTFTWTSSDTTIARVDANGTLIAVGAGEATLTAASGNRTGTAVVSVRQKDIAAIRITPATSALLPGTTEQLEITAFDDANRVVSVSKGQAKWTTSSTSILTVGDDGIAQAKAKGSAVVTASVGSKSATATVNVLAVPVAKVVVTLGASTLEPGQSTNATAELSDSAGTSLTGRTIAWQSSNPAIAVVSSSGAVTAVAKGTATITAIAEGKTGTAGLTVGSKTVAAVSVSPNSASAAVGQTAQLTATPKDAQGVALTGRTLTWTSNHPAVATVSASGVVTAIAAGTVTISATADGITGQAAFASTTITAASVSITPSSPRVPAGQSLQLVATAVDAAGNPLSTRVPRWSASNPTVATVANDGRVTGVSKGSTTIVATVDGKNANVALTVDSPTSVPVASVSVTLGSSSLTVGQTTPATVTLRDGSGNVLTGRTVTWSSAATELATVSTSGLVTAISAGTATIVATSEGQSGSATAVIGGGAAQPVASVTLSAASTSMTAGLSQSITAVLKDAQGTTLSGRTIAWSSSDLTVLTVSPAGEVQAVGAGTATVTATSEGKSGTLSISVAAPVVPVATVSVTGTTTSLGVGQTTQLTATPKDGHGTALTDRAITWSSSAPNVASVSSTGVVTAVAAGSAVINAISEGVTGSLGIAVSAPGGALATVSVSLASAVVTLGQTTQATAIAKDANGNAIAASTPTWTTSNAAVATVSASGLITAVSGGSATISATISGKTGSASLSVALPSIGPVQATLPALPRSEPSPIVPAPTGKTIRVPAGGDLQAALNSALPGDVVALQSGATWVGNFVLPAKPCTGWITVRTDVPDSDLPGTGQRITPAYASKLAKVMTDNNQPAISTAIPTCQWRLFGLEVAVHPSFTGLQYHLLTMGDGGWIGGGEKQLSLDKVPTDIVVDRMYVHGQNTTNLVRCIAINSARSSIVNSYIDQCHALGLDSQAIEGWNGPGPYLIENNFVAGGTENIMFGGADPGITGLSPSDITIRRNHVYKDPAWKGVWLVKNLFELKNARRVLVEGNVFENNWADGQSGMAIVIKSSQDACGTCTWEGTTDLTFRYNIVRNSPRGFNLQAVDCYGQACVDVHVQRVRAEHNLFENIGTFNGTGADGWLILLTHDLTDVGIVHNTFVGNLPGAGISVVMDYSLGNARRIQIDDNVLAGQNYYALFTSGAKVGTESMQAFAPSSWSFNRNVVPNIEEQFVSWHPATSFYPRVTSDIGFAGAGDYRLSSGSSYRGKASDGSDPGADFTGLAQKTAGVVQR